LRKNWVSVLHDAVNAVYARANGDPLLVRVGVPAGEMDPFQWLAARPVSDRLVWHARHHSEIVFACGNASEVSGDGPPDPDSIDANVREILERPGDDMRLFGGVRFDGQRLPDEQWAGFGGYRFVLPRFECIARSDQVQVYCNLVFPEDSESRSEILAEIDSLGDQSQVKHQAGVDLTPVGRSNHPDQTNWESRIHWLLGELQAGQNAELAKVVLARRADLVFDEEVQPLSLLRQLIPATPGCFHYHFEAPDGEAFIGASPERLFFRNGRSIESEAVAGTQPRGKTDYDDEQFRTSLLNSDKELREHAFVREYIVEALEAVCESVSIDHEASEMKLTRGRHLVSRITGVLDEDVSSLNLLRDLHPTPAVGGVPSGDAVRIIREVEEFDRGWYAGPVGWLGRDQAHFAVALRCGLIRDRILSLFSGAGIVRGSEPTSEWREIEQKIQDFVNVLELDLERAD